jgi:hypothetical protein
VNLAFAVLLDGDTLIGTSKAERLPASGVTGRRRVVGDVEGEHVPHHDQARVLTAMRD